MTVLERKGVSPPMTHTASAVGTPDLSAVRLGVDATLRTFLDRKEEAAPGPEMAPLFTTLRHLLTSGKRLRSQLCVAGWQGAGGQDHFPAVLRAAAGLEMFHAFALIHDDIMDGSPVRRGRPSAHCALADAHVAGGGRPSDADAHGRHAAVVLGDMALSWAHQLLATAGAAAHTTARLMDLMSSMCDDLAYGQYLDLRPARWQDGDVETALRIARYKTATYTVERPLHIGAALAGADRTSWRPTALSRVRSVRPSNCATTSWVSSETPP